MSETSQEPTMEEILASIRRIISEDDAPADGDAPAKAEAPAATAPADEPDLATAAAVEAEPLAAFDDDVLELTDPLDRDVETLQIDDALGISDLEVVAPSAAEPSFAAEPLVTDIDRLVSEPVATDAASKFAVLERSLLMPAEGRTLEDVVRELLRPMLKAWLDEYLPSIVETQVKAEVERIARQRR